MTSAADLLRRHLTEEGFTVGRDLAGTWGVTPVSAYRRMSGRSPLTPDLVEQAVAMLRLDDFDAAELHAAAARDAGWRIPAPDNLGRVRYPKPKAKSRRPLPPAKTFRQAVRQARTRDRLSQFQLASIVGCDPATIQGLESGKWDTRRTIAARIVEALDLPASTMELP